MVETSIMKIHSELMLLHLCHFFFKYVLYPKYGKICLILDNNLFKMVYIITYHIFFIQSSKTRKYAT